MRLGGERQVLDSGQMVYIPPGVFHQRNDIPPFSALTPIRSTTISCDAANKTNSLQ
jgi:hypothetical protein